MCAVGSPKSNWFQSRIDKRMNNIVPRLLKTFVEIPVPKAFSNEEVLNQVSLFPRDSISGVVFSDKAGGLERFCEAEDILQRQLIPDARSKLAEAGNGDHVWNVLRTGDRCSPKLQELMDSLESQGSSGFLLVSGHDYRASLLRRASKGEKCTKACKYRQGEESILCGKLSSQVAADHTVRTTAGAKLGLVLTRRGDDVKNEPTVDFHITQACPPITTDQWLDSIKIHNLPASAVYITIIPTLSITGLPRIQALGTDLPMDQLRKELNVPNPKERGIELAKEAMEKCARRPQTGGFYLYSHDVTALVELARFARTLK